MMWLDEGSGLGYAVMAFVMIALLVVIVWAFVAFRRTDSRMAGYARFGGSGETPTAGAERILAERFARAEIDADDYHRHLADLRQHPTGTRS